MERARTGISKVVVVRSHTISLVGEGSKGLQAKLCMSARSQDRIGTGTAAAYPVNLEPVSPGFERPLDAMRWFVVQGSGVVVVRARPHVGQSRSTLKQKYIM